MNMLNLSIAVTAAALLVLLIKLAAGNRITPRGHMLLWLPVAAAILAVPLAGVLPESDLAVRAYLPQTQARVVMPHTEPAQGSDFYEDPDGSVQASEQPSDAQGVTGTQSGRTQVSMQVPFTDRTITGAFPASAGRDRLKTGIYIAGVLMVLGGLLIGTGKQRKKLRALEDSEDAQLRQQLTELRTKIGIRSLAKISIKQGAGSTFLTRLDGRYVIALESGFDEAEQRQVLAHELTHLAHGDLEKNFIAAAVLAAFWWNPIIWLAFRRFRRDMEVYCDYDAARLTGDKKTYAATLVKAAAGTERFLLGTTSFIGGEKEVSARVKALAAFKKPKTWIAAAAILALAVGCVCFAVKPQTDEGNCAKYFSRIKMDDVRWLRVIENESPVYGTTFEEPIVLRETADIEKLLQIFHGLKKEDFTEQPTGSTGNFPYALEIVLKSGEKLSLRGDMADGEGLYYISKYQEEPYEQNGINGCWLICPQLNELIEAYRQASLYVNFWIYDGYTREVQCMITNDEKRNAGSVLYYDDSYRLERYTGEVSGELNGYEKQDLSYERTGWEEVAKISDAGAPQESQTQPEHLHTLKYREWGGEQINLQKDYGTLPSGVYRITKTFTQERKTGTVTKECRAVFVGTESKLEKADWGMLLAQPDGELSEETIDKLNSLFEAWKGGSMNVNTLYCFFTSEYSSPEKMDFEKFLRYYPQFDVFQEWTPELKEKFENSAFWSDERKEGWTVDNFITPVKLYRPDVLDESLEYYAGISLNDLRANSTPEKWKQNYAAEIDRYVTFTSDAGSGQFVVEKGQKSGDTVTLVGETYIWKGTGEDADYERGISVLTLQEADGRYLIRSLLPSE